MEVVKIPLYKSDIVVNKSSLFIITHVYKNLHEPNNCRPPPQWFLNGTAYRFTSHFIFVASGFSSHVLLRSLLKAFFLLKTLFSPQVIASAWAPARTRKTRVAST